MLIEHDEKANASIQPAHNEAAAGPGTHHGIAPRAPPNGSGTIAQPNNQELFEKLHNQLKVQSQNSNFNLNLTQVPPNHHSTSSHEINLHNQRHPDSYNSQNRRLPAAGPHQEPDVKKASRPQSQVSYTQSPQTSMLQASSLLGGAQNAAARVVPTFSPAQPKNLPAQQTGSRGATASQHSGQRVASSSMPALKVNKEIPAQDDLRQIMIQDARKIAIE